MAENAQRLMSGNPSLGQRITVCFVSLGTVHFFVTFDPELIFDISLPREQVIRGKVEEVELPEKADILISEPMGMSLFEVLQCY